MSSPLKPYEIGVLRQLLASEFSESALENILKNGAASVEHLLNRDIHITITHPEIGEARRVHSGPPFLFGQWGEHEAAFLIFLEANELTLEIYSWNDMPLPHGFREADVKIIQKNGSAGQDSRLCELFSQNMKKSCRELLIGIWFGDGLSFEEEGILVISPDFRVVRFPTSVTFPQFIQTHRLWVTDEGADLLRFRPYPEAEGYLRRVEFKEGGFTLIAIDNGSEVRFNYRHAPTALLPSWYLGQLDRNLCRMEEIESKSGAEQKEAARPVFL